MLMKLIRQLPLLAFLPLIAFANPTFPGLQQIMTEAEWKRAGLDKLTPDQIGVIDAALIKHYAQALQAAAPPVLPPTATPAEAAAAKSRFWDKFGLGKSDTDWRLQPPMAAKVTSWRGSNRFVLDNGQVWEGIEPIPFELPGKSVTIEARPLGAYALKLGEDSLAVRVRRVQ